MDKAEHASKKLSYLDSGVDIDAGAELVERIKPAVRSTLRSEVISGLGGFGGLFQIDLSKWKSPVLVSGTDGVGTKLMLARELDLHDSIGIDLVAMCVNDILVCGAEPLFFLDYYATGKLDLTTAESVINGIAEGCRQAGCSLIGGETAEMPGMYEGKHYDLAGFAVGMVERTEVLDGSRIKAGHRLLGMPSSGPHSNGYSLIRKVIELSRADLAAPLVENDGSVTPLGHALLAPTVIYVKPILELLRSGYVDGLAHITGGGLTDNITRVIPQDLGIVIDLDSWRRPAVFDWLQQQGNIDDREMLRTFNCGIGMVIAVAAEHAESLIQASEQVGYPCRDIGHVIYNENINRVDYVRA